MTAARKILFPFAAILFALALSAQAQVATMIPANAWVVLKVSNLDATSQKISDFCKALGLTQMVPTLDKPLDSLLAQLGIHDGVNRAGEMAFVGVDPAPFNTTYDQAGIILIPVSDYQAFLGNFKDNQTDGDITAVHMPTNPNAVYAAHWGDYAAVSPVKEIIAKQPTSMLQISPAVQKEWDSKDIMVMINVAPVRAIVTPQLEQFKQTASDFLDQQAQTPAGPNNPMTMALGGMDMAKAVPLLKVAANQLIAVAEEYVQQTDALTMGIKIAPDGITTSTMVAFQPDSYHGQLAAKIKNTDASLLAGLPDGKYLFFGGTAQDPATTTEILSHFLDPAQKAINDLGPDYSGINDYFALIKSAAAASTSGSFGMVAPSGMLGQEPLVQFVGARYGDSKTLLDDTHKAFDMQQSMIATLGMKNQMSQQTYTPAAKTVDGVTFDDLATSFKMAGAGPGRAQATQMLNFVYGPTGMHMLMGAVDDKTFLTESGLNDAMLSAAISAAKSGDDPLAKSAAVKAIAAQLPTQRLVAIYLPLDVWASTGLNYAKQFGMDMGVKIPDDLPPIGATFSTDGPTVRVDGYIPTQLIQALTSAGLQMYMTSQRPQNGGAPGGGL
jgi:hypothetical protein